MSERPELRWSCSPEMCRTLIELPGSTSVEAELKILNVSGPAEATWQAHLLNAGCSRDEKEQ